MQREQREIILFLDNAGCHPVSLQEMFSNIKVVFLPPNTTSRLQPIDAGVIKNFKVRYKFVVSRVNRRLTAPYIAKEVDVLQVIRWIKQAWMRYQKKLFRSALTNVDFPMWYRITRDLRKKGIKNSQSLYDDSIMWASC